MCVKSQPECQDPEVIKAGFVIERDVQGIKDLALSLTDTETGEIVRKDTITIERSNQLAEANSAKLQVESERLSEHTGSACRCWVWFLLAIVCVTFIAMVMVMKIFRKRKHDEL